MRAMILAAGLGTRMRPLTDHTPKPLLEVGGKPLIVWHIEALAVAGIHDIVINTAWLGEKIPAYLGDGSRYHVRLHYSPETEALETAGGIIQALPLLGDEPFLVVNGDIWLNYDFAHLKSALAPQHLAHLVLVDNPAHNPKGDFGLDNASAITPAQPYPALNDGGQRFTFAGLSVLHPSLFKGLEEGKRPLAPLLRQAIEQHRVSAEYFPGPWVDVGTPERLYELDGQLREQEITL